MMKGKCSVLDWISLILVIIGGINWGLLGFLKVDIVALLFGEMTAITRIIYALIGLAALYTIYMTVKCAKECKNNTGMNK